MEQIPCHSHVQHADFIYQHQVCIHLFRYGQGVRLASSQVQRLMDSASGKPGALLQPSCCTACGRTTDNVCIRERLTVDIQEDTLNGRFSSARTAGDNTDGGCKGGLDRLPLFFCQDETQFFLLLVNLVIQITDIGQTVPLKHFPNTLGNAVFSCGHNRPIYVVMIQNQPVRF